MRKYALDTASGWAIDWEKGRNDSDTVIKLEQIRRRHSNFKYLNAAFSLIVGDLQLRMKKPYLAKSSYLRVSTSQDDDLKVYRDLAIARLKRL